MRRRKLSASVATVYASAIEGRRETRYFLYLSSKKQRHNINVEEMLANDV